MLITHKDLLWESAMSQALGLISFSPPSFPWYRSSIICTLQTRKWIVLDRVPKVTQLVRDGGSEEADWKPRLWGIGAYVFSTTHKPTMYFFFFLKSASWLWKATYQIKCKPRICIFVFQALSGLLFSHKTSWVTCYEEPNPAMLLCQERPPFQLNNHRAEALQILMLHKQEIVVANINVQFSCSHWEKKE